MQALHNNIIVEPIAEDHVSAGGIILLATSVKGALRGKVVAVGPGSEKNPMYLKVDDIVLFPKESPAKLFEEGGKKYLRMLDEIVLATV